MYHEKNISFMKKDEYSRGSLVSALCKMISSAYPKILVFIVSQIYAT